MVTIKEIAELAGVSRGTVDRVLNKRGNVNPKTEEKILNIIESLDYTPNRAGLALAATKKNWTIGIILFCETNPFFDDIIQGIEAKSLELTSYGIKTIVKRTGLSVQEQLDAIHEIEKEDPAGLILAPFDNPLIQKEINILSNKNIPVVTVNTDTRESRRLAYVGSDYYEAGKTAAGIMNLITQGDVNLGIISGSTQVLCHEERIHGFLETAKKDYSRIHLITTAENQDDDIESYKVTLNMLKSHPDINALFFASAGVYGGCKAVVDSGRDIKILTFDTLSGTIDFLKKGVIAATISQQPYLQGYRSLEILFEYLLSRQVPDKIQNYVSSTIVIKENCDSTPSIL